MINISSYVKCFRSKRTYCNTGLNAFHFDQLKYVKISTGNYRSISNGAYGSKCVSQTTVLSPFISPFAKASWRCRCLEWFLQLFLTFLIVCCCIWIWSQPPVSQVVRSSIILRVLLHIVCTLLLYSLVALRNGLRVLIFYVSLLCCLILAKYLSMWWTNVVVCERGIGTDNGIASEFLPLSVGITAQLWRFDLISSVWEKFNSLWRSLCISQSLSLGCWSNIDSLACYLHLDRCCTRTFLSSADPTRLVLGWLVGRSVRSIYDPFLDSHKMMCVAFVLLFHRSSFICTNDA